MRCPSCNKFPAFEVQEPEPESLDCSEGVVTGSLRLFLTTECCGEEAKETSFDVEVDLADEIRDKLKAAGVPDPDLSAEGVEFEVDEGGVSADDRYDGKPGTPMRYRKHFYSASLDFTVKCEYPNPTGETIHVEVPGAWSDEVQASAMDELV